MRAKRGGMWRILFGAGFGVNVIQVWWDVTGNCTKARAWGTSFWAWGRIGQDTSGKGKVFGEPENAGFLS